MFLLAVGREVGVSAQDGKREQALQYVRGDPIIILYTARCDRNTAALTIPIKAGAIRGNGVQKASYWPRSPRA